MDNRPIGMFDSGMGAFSVLKQLIQIMPNEDYLFFGDSAHNPYGQKTEKQLKILCETITRFLISQGAKMIVISCNTATVASMPYLIKKFPDIDIIGVIEGGVKEALEVTKNGKIEVCATMFTANSHAYKKKIDELKGDREITVYEAGNADLAYIIEHGFDSKKDVHRVRDFLKSFETTDADTLILGCTHYALVIDEFKKYYFGNIIDPGKNTAIRAKEVLTKKDMLSGKRGNGHLKYFITGDTQEFKNVASNLVDLDVTDVNKYDMEEEISSMGFYE